MAGIPTVSVEKTQTRNAIFEQSDSAIELNIDAMPE
jgi:hypothetical protein